MSTSAAATSVVVAGALKPLFILAISAVIRDQVNPTYASPHCALRSVNETNPVHYNKHPVWRQLKYDEAECPDWEPYRLGQQTNVGEYTFAWYNRSARLLIALACLMMYTKLRSIKDVFKNFVLLPVAYQMMMYCAAAGHFTSDISVLNGALIHHAIEDNYVAPGAEYNGVKTIAEGYVLSVTCSIMFYSYCLWLLLGDHNSTLSKAINFPVLLAMFWIVLEIGFQKAHKEHVRYHSMESIPTDARPYTSDYRAHAHVTIHHNEGINLIGDPMMDPIFDCFIDLFGKLYAPLGLKFGTLGHYSYVCFWEAIISIVGVVVLWLELHVARLLLCVIPEPKPKLADGKKVA